MGHARVPNFVSDRVQENALPFPVPIEVNQRDAAAVLGLTTRQIRNLDEAGIPSRPAGDGRGRVYDLVEVVPWYIREVRRQSRTNESDLDRAKLEQAELEVRRRRIEVAKAEGELIADDQRAVPGALRRAPGAPAGTRGHGRTRHPRVLLHPGHEPAVQRAGGMRGREEDETPRGDGCRVSASGWRIARMRSEAVWLR